MRAICVIMTILHWDLIRSLGRAHIALASADWPSTRKTRLCGGQQSPRRHASYLHGSGIRMCRRSPHVSESTYVNVILIVVDNGQNCNILPSIPRLLTGMANWARAQWRLGGQPTEFDSRTESSLIEGPAASSGHRNPPRHIPDFEENQLFHLILDLPHWLFPAHS